jgi:hypothetical protein
MTRGSARLILGPQSEITRGRNLDSTRLTVVDFVKQECPVRAKYPLWKRGSDGTWIMNLRR